MRFLRSLGSLPLLLVSLRFSPSTPTSRKPRLRGRKWRPALKMATEAPRRAPRTRTHLPFSPPPGLPTRPLLLLVPTRMDRLSRTHEVHHTSPARSPAGRPTCDLLKFLLESYHIGSDQSVFGRFAFARASCFDNAFRLGCVRLTWFNLSSSLSISFSSGSDLSFFGVPIFFGVGTGSNVAEDPIAGSVVVLVVPWQACSVKSALSWKCPRKASTQAPSSAGYLPG